MIHAAEGLSVGVADAARFCRTPVVSGRAGQVASRCEIGDGATIPTAVANSDIALGPDRELAGVGCAECPRHKSMELYIGV